MSTTLLITFDEQLEEIERELAMRRSLYPRWISEGKLKQAVADQKFANLKAALETFKALKQYQKTLPAPFFSARSIPVNLY